MKPSLVILSSIVAASAAHAATPPCRLSHDAQMQSAVRAVFEDLLPRFRAKYPAFNYTEVTFEAAAAANALPVEVVIDAEKRSDGNLCPTTTKPLAHPPIVPDGKTIVSVCAATRTQPRRILCSESALHALAGAGTNGQLVLWFLLAHELGHLVTSTSGGFADGPSLLKLDTDGATKRQKIADSCNANQAERVDEERADAIAIDALVDRARAAQPQDRDAAIAATMTALRLGAEALREYQLRGPRTMAWPIVPEDIQLPASATGVDWAVARTLCRLTQSKHGFVALPLLYGSHADGIARLVIAERALMTKMDQPTPRPVSGRQPSAQQLQSLANTMALVDHTLDEEFVDFRAQYTAQLCRDVRKPMRACDGVSAKAPADPVACAGLVGKLLERPISLSAEPASAVVDQALAMKVRVGALALGDAGDIWIATTEPARLVRWPRAAPAAQVTLPCAAAAIAAHGDSFAVTCVEPMRVVRGRFGGAATLASVEQVLADDETVGADQLVVNWMGFVGDRLTASVRPPSGTSFDIELSAEHFETLPAWRSGKCSSVHSGLALFGMRDFVIGTPATRSAEPETAIVDARLERIVTVKPRSATGAAGAACGPSWSSRAMICVAAKGDVAAAGRLLGHVPIGDDAQVCGDAAADWVATTKAGRLDVYQLNRGVARKIRSDSDVVKAVLACSPAGAAIDIEKADGATVVRLQ